MVRWIATLVLVAAASAGTPHSTAFAAGKGSLKIDTSLVGATVWVDGKSVGTTPLKAFVVRAGTHRVVVKKPGYRDLDRRLRVRRGQSVRLAAELQPVAGVLIVTADVAGATVLVDGKKVGAVPLERELAVGSHTVTVRAAGGRLQTHQIVAVAGVENRLHVQLTGQGAAETDDANLALVPPGGGGGGLDADDPLALAPLAPLTGSRGEASGTDPAATAGDAGMPSLELIPPRPEPGSGGVTAAMTHPELGTTAQAAPRWYEQWWFLSAAGAVLVSSVALTAVMVTRGGGGDDVAQPDDTLRLRFDTLQPARPGLGGP